MSTGPKELKGTGPKGISSKHGTKKDGAERVARPSTSKALVLRKEARGDQEIATVTKMIGREKLQILAGIIVSVAYSPE